MPRLKPVAALAAILVSCAIAGAGLFASPRTASATVCEECQVPTPIAVINQIVADKAPAKTVKPKGQTQVQYIEVTLEQVFISN